MLLNKNVLSASSGSVFYLTFFFFRLSDAETCHFQRTDCVKSYRSHLRMVHCKTTRWYCLNRVSALNAIQVWLSHCGGQTGEICLLQNSHLRMYAAWKGHSVIALEESSFSMWILKALGTLCPQAWKFFITKCSEQVYIVRRNPLLACLSHTHTAPLLISIGHILLFLKPKFSLMRRSFSGQ